MRILVTGGAGFQGSNLCRALLARGDEVTILNTYSLRSRLNLERFGLGAATVVWGSVTDPDVVAKTARDHGLVVHLAANIHVDESRGKPEAYYRTNVLGTLNVAEACRQYDVPLLHVSTCEVYGGCLWCPEPCSQAITERCPLKPQSPYAASKAAGDLLIQAHAVTYGLRAVVVRPGNVFGPGQRHGSRGAVVPIFVDRALRGEPLVINGDGSQKRDFVPVAYLVEAYLFLIGRLSCLKTPLVVNVGTGHARTILDLARTIRELTGGKCQILHKHPRPGEVSSFRLDSSRLARLGFRRPVPSAMDLEKYIAWFRAHEVCS